MTKKVNKSFWKNKKVFVTGHTGFKGSWICTWLNFMGSIVRGYSLTPKTSPKKSKKLIKSKTASSQNYSDGSETEYEALPATPNTSPKKRRKLTKSKKASSQNESQSALKPDVSNNQSSFEYEDIKVTKLEKIQNDTLYLLFILLRCAEEY